MWRTMYKLTKTFGDQAGPRRIADSVKGKIDKFKQHLPILHTICNPGIRDRHWEAVGVSFLFFYWAVDEFSGLWLSLAVSFFCANSWLQKFYDFENASCTIDWTLKFDFDPK
ncbi:hypothetical protein DPMN_030193 [Dreissena polymorpha]|uniref:Dynein heavy chain linker domain-containing protein n=1 Tax=Dreissena polymorpha TaxID=45954 RepID=A0A9D4LYK8_DREPO|nr:hypothetical protein DPMN_030193 [Dreissena polymorpha]